MARLLRITMEHDGKTFEDYQGAWWQDRPARRDRWGRGRCLRHPPPSLSAASPSWSPGQSYTCQCHRYGEVAFLPFCHSQENLKLLSHQTPSFKWACHDSCSRPPAKPLTTSPGMKYLSWNIQKQGAIFLQLHVIPLKWILASYIKAFMCQQTVSPLDRDFSRNVCLERKSWLSIDDEYHVQVLVTKAGKDVKCHKKCPFGVALGYWCPSEVYSVNFTACNNGNHLMAALIISNVTQLEQFPGSPSQQLVGQVS